MIPVSRRDAIRGLASLVAAGRAAGPASYTLSTFRAEVTPPLGHPLMGGGIAPAAEVLDPLLVHGLVLLGGEKPLVVAAVDWCEIRNEAYEHWRGALARAAGTVAERVLVTSIHQNDAPVADLEIPAYWNRYVSRAVGLDGTVADLERIYRDPRFSGFDLYELQWPTVIPER